jgi:hypothetical protein
MDDATIRAIADLIQTGGHAALIIMIYIGSMLARAVRDAIKLLHRIEMALIQSRADVGAQHSIVESRLDSIHSDLQSLPLNIMRQQRGSKI